MSAEEIVEELRSQGSEATKKVLLKHGAKEPFFGVKIEYLKKIKKRIKQDHQLALELYDTGISDAMYLAGMLVDDAQMTKKDLQRWADNASWSMISESTVPPVAAGSPVGREMALKWIDSKKESVAATGWATLGFLVGTREDADLDLAELQKLLDRVARTINEQPNRVRYQMNHFIIAVGAYVKELHELAMATARKLGKVSVEMGETACKVPSAVEYIQKIKARGGIGKKRKSAKC